MKKIPLYLKIIIPLAVIVAGCGIFFTIRLIGANKLFAEKSDAIVQISQIPIAESIKSFEHEKHEEKENNEDNLATQSEFAQYQYNNILFLSYSEEWDEEDLKLLCEELLKNTHGREIDYLNGVTLYGHEDDKFLGLHEGKLETIDIPLSLFGLFVEDFKYRMPNDISILTLYNCDKYNTVEQLSITLSHEYGHHFTMFYFNLKNCDVEEIENDPYFKLRFIPDIGIRYGDKTLDDYGEYLDNHMWYLIEIAAEDYVYLMGSPSSKRQKEYLDSLDTLKLSVKGKDEEYDEYYEYINENSFNQSPQENISLELPDQVEGLAELFYGSIGSEPPKYEDRNDEAQKIEIEISARIKADKKYYNITWNKPWVSDDVTYTLVAYDENDNLLGAIKSVSGDEKALACIGSVVYETKKYYHFYNGDYWTDQDFLRLRVIVTFGDGTAVVSPSVDRRF